MLIFSFESQIHLFLCCHTQEALAISRILEPDWASSVLAQNPASVWTFYPFDCEHEENLCRAVRWDRTPVRIVVRKTESLGSVTNPYAISAKQEQRFVKSMGEPNKRGPTSLCLKI
ncbi:MAG: hypothetical protein JO077_23985 [Verrucomicrobia bacterium]|nr:hypothetical protein [Verrucomicrobiota bacterium]